MTHSLCSVCCKCGSETTIPVVYAKDIGINGEEKHVLNMCCECFGNMRCNKARCCNPSCLIYNNNSTYFSKVCHRHYWMKHEHDYRHPYEDDINVYFPIIRIDGLVSDIDYMCDLLVMLFPDKYSEDRRSYLGTVVERIDASGGCCGNDGTIDMDDYYFVNGIMINSTSLYAMLYGYP